MKNFISGENSTSMNNSEIWDNDGIQIRFMRNPILEAIVDHKWESKMVYNC